MAGIRLEWAQFGDFDSFDVIRSDTSMANVADEDLPSPIATNLKTMYYVDMTVVLGSNYYYKVKAWRDDVGVVSSGEISALAGMPWTPHDLAKTATYQYDDTTAINVSGSLISAIYNSNSSKAIYFSSHINQPALTVHAASGKRSITFDGTNDILQSSSSEILQEYKNTGTAWAFLVIRRTGTDNSNRIIIGNAGGNYSGGGRFNVGTYNNSPYLYCERVDDASGSTLMSNHVFNATDTVIIFVKVNFANATAQFYINGAAENEVNFGTAGATSNTNAVYQSGISNFNQNLCADFELVTLMQSGVSSAIPSNDEIDKLNGWAAHKYGLTVNLPSDHPYKVTPPIM